MPFSSPRKIVATAVTTLAVALVGTLSTAPAAVAGQTLTDYGFGGRGFGTELRGGSTGIRSGRTAQAQLGCTRLTGERRQNFAAAVNTDGQGLTADGIDSHTQSYETKRTFGTLSSNRIAKVVIGDPNAAHIKIEGLRTTANAFVNRQTGKLGARSAYTSTNIASTGTPADDVLNEADAGIKELLGAIAAEPNNELEIPGFGVVKLGSKNNKVRPRKSIAQASALRIVLYGEDTTRGTRDDILAIIGKSRSSVRAEVRSGVFTGGAVPAAAEALGGLVRVGPVIKRPLPCEGTGGKVRSTAGVGSDLFQAGAIRLGALKAESWGIQRDNRSAKAWTRAAVAGLNLGDGAIEVKGIVGRALVESTRMGKIKTRSTAGSAIGSLVLDGEEHAIPDPGQAIEVPGVAKLQFFVKQRYDRGVKMTALRVTLLDGTGAVVNLGTARTKIKRS